MIEQAATRDASWYNRPDVRKPKKYHILGANELSACGGAILIKENLITADEVPKHARCQRAGCKGRWPTK